MPKHVVVPYVENTSYPTNKYSCVRTVHTLYIGYFIENNGDDEPHDCKPPNTSKGPSVYQNKNVLSIRMAMRQFTNSYESQKAARGGAEGTGRNMGEGRGGGK